MLQGSYSKSLQDIWLHYSVSQSYCAWDWHNYHVLCRLVTKSVLGICHGHCQWSNSLFLAFVVGQNYSSGFPTTLKHHEIFTREQPLFLLGRAPHLNEQCQPFEKPFGAHRQGEIGQRQKKSIFFPLFYSKVPCNSSATSQIAWLVISRDCHPII